MNGALSMGGTHAERSIDLLHLNLCCINLSCHNYHTVLDLRLFIHHVALSEGFPCLHILSEDHSTMIPDVTIENFLSVAPTVEMLRLP